MQRYLLVTMVGFLAGASCRTEGERYACTEEDALALYDRRIAPLLAQGAPSSCNECHLSGIDLAMFAQDTPCGTMACMAAKGLVDMNAPEESLVLDWILRADPASPLITPDVVEKEHDAMLEWIEYSARCGAEVCPASAEGACGQPPTYEDCELPPSAANSGRKPWDDPGDCSDRTIELMFQETVYAWRGRCYPCHFSDHEGEPLDAPRWISTGDCAIGSLETMRTVVRNGYVDTTSPIQSLLLLKPLAEDAGGVEHGGGDKSHDASDPAYSDFLAWLTRYQTCVGSQP